MQTAAAVVAQTAAAVAAQTAAAVAAQWRPSGSSGMGNGGSAMAAADGSAMKTADSSRSGTQQEEEAESIIPVQEVEEEEEEARRMTQGEVDAWARYGLTGSYDDEECQCQNCVAASVRGREWRGLPVRQGRGLPQSDGGCQLGVARVAARWPQRMEAP